MLRIRGELIPKFQSPISITKICSEIIRDSNLNNKLNQKVIDRMIGLIYYAILYHGKHQSISVENKIVGRTNYESPNDSIMLSMYGACLLYKYSQSQNGLNQQNINTIAKIFEIAYEKNINNKYAYYNWKFIYPLKPGVKFNTDQIFDIKKRI